MPKRKPEMSSAHPKNTNEFVFGEKGGRGKNLSSFLKNLSLTGSSQRSEKDSPDHMRKVNSSIYGNMQYGYESPDRGGSALTSVSQNNISPVSRGSRKSSPRRTVSSSSAINLASNYGKLAAPGSPSRSQAPKLPIRAASASAGSPTSAWRRQKYADLDDDWDADFSDMGEAKPGSEPPKGPQKVDSNGQRGLASVFVGSLFPDLTIQSQTEEATEPSPKTAKFEPNRAEPSNRAQARIAKFTRVLGDDAPAVNIQELRKLSWNGIPSGLRAVTWQLLLGYLPTNKTRQRSILQRKRQEYVEGMAKYAAQFDEVPVSASLSDSNNRDNSANKEKQLFHQINIDVKRTNQTLRLYSYGATQKSLKKILFLWAIRHPASGYVQGINDICTPFYQIFFQNYLWQLQRKHAHEFGGANDDSALFIPGLLDESFTEPEELEIYNDPNLAQLSWENFDPGRLSSRVTHIIEADSYWCISRLLDNITDNYIHEQPGIIKQVTDLHDLIAKIDPPLVQHLQSEGIEFLQFSFRWMNCLLMRELSIELVIRMWDTYLSETPLGFSGFHIYVCAAFLIKFSAEIKEKDFQDILLFLQNPPTNTWTEQDIELMLSEAFIWQSLYKNAGARAR